MVSPDRNKAAFPDRNAPEPKTPSIERTKGRKAANLSLTPINKGMKNRLNRL